MVIAFSLVFVPDSPLLVRYPGKYIPSNALQAVGRQAISKLLSMHRDEINKHQLYGLDRVLEECLSKSATKDDIEQIIDLLCEGIQSFRLYGFPLEQISDYLVKNYPEVILDKVFENKDNSDQLIYWLFKEHGNRRQSPLNMATVEQVIEWCNGSEDKIQKVANIISAYTSVDKIIQQRETPKQVILSSHIKSLLEIAEDKVAIVETIFSRTFPSGWSGSLAEILEVRSKAFAELLNYPSPEVQVTVNMKLSLLAKSIKENREQEAKKYSWREQRFE